MMCVDKGALDLCLFLLWSVVWSEMKWNCIKSLSNFHVVRIGIGILSDQPEEVVDSSFVFCISGDVVWISDLRVSQITFRLTQTFLILF